LYKIPAGTLFLGKNLVILPECPSTNTLAAELSQAGRAPEGTVVITHHQTAGRGQRGNTWQSGEGLNLTLSVVLQPVFLSVVRQFQLNKAVALAVRDTVSKYTDEPVFVKWPNDIMIGDKKVCGILIENQLTGDKLGRSIVGIGLNVNQTEFESTLASSVSLHAGKSLELGVMFEELLQFLEWRYLQLRSETQIDNDYLNVLYRFNQKRYFVVDDLEVEGIIRDVNEIGKLIVEIDNKSRSFDLKEIKFVY
jgi:BirA family biotin operon repressor/biotin-[acetyl-CoA-carboxylase] ligase